MPKSALLRGKFIKPDTTHWTEQFSSGLLWKTFFSFVLNFYLPVGYKMKFCKSCGYKLQKNKFENL